MSVSRRLWELRRERPLFVVLAVVTVLSVVLWPAADALLNRYDVVHISSYGFNDFGAYSNAVDNWLSGEEPIYTENEDGGFHGSYLYPPHVLPLFYPFTQLDFFVGAVLFGLFSLFLFWVGVEAVIGELGVELAVTERIVLMFALFGFHPALWDFKWGQVSTLLAALLCFAFYTHERGNSGNPGNQYVSGILTALASSVKLFVAPSGAHLLRNRRRLSAALGTAVLCFGGSLLVFGVDAHRLYLDVLRWGKGWGTAQRPPADWETAYYRPMYLIDQIFESLGIPLPNVWMIAITALGIVGVIGLVVATRPRGAGNTSTARLAFALGVAVVPLLAPRAYTHDLVLLVLPAVVLLAVEFERDDGLPWLPVLAVLLVHFHSVGLKLLIDLLGSSWAVLLQPGAYGTYLLVGLATVRLVEHVPTTDT